MENNQGKLKELMDQDQLRVAVLNRCKSQKEIAKEIGISNIYLNTFLKKKRTISKKLAAKIQVWLDA
ncbi:hypothetical protein KAR91_70715 [Candidatus Pacearchaeota archaeon]|nr:hypothetical protein [Candidatus Pacearchaeota archaeon]